jgi:hypothetical protein
LRSSRETCEGSTSSRLARSAWLTSAAIRKQMRECPKLRSEVNSPRWSSAFRRSRKAA